MPDLVFTANAALIYRGRNHGEISLSAETSRVPLDEAC